MTFLCLQDSRSIKSSVSGHCQEDHPNEKRARNKYSLCAFVGGGGSNITHGFSIFLFTTKPS